MFGITAGELVIARFLLYEAQYEVLKKYIVFKQTLSIKFVLWKTENTNL